MDFSSAVQWWEEWQLRILVLSSLAIQFYLAWFTRARKCLIGPVYRFSIWLSYLGADAVAIYALATLFNRQRKAKCSSSASVDLGDLARRSIEVLWAPILLMHLGGQVIISAYNIEDNELWTRHLVTAVSQVAVSLYVFCKSWSSTRAYANKRYLAAAILMFVPGICKCFERPLALKRASFKSLANSSHAASRTETTDTELELEEYIQKARDLVRNPSGRLIIQGGRQRPYLEISRPDNLFVDLAYPYPHRLAALKYFWLFGDAASYKELQRGLSHVFYRLYTKDRSGFCSGFTQHITILLPVAYFLLPGTLSRLKDGIDRVRVDVNVTDVLIFLTYFLEYSLRKYWELNDYWHNKVAQHNLVGFFARNKRHSWLISIAGCLQCGDFLNQFWCMEPSSSGEDITTIVRHHVKDGWMNYILDAESYRKFCDIRGQLTLERNGCDQQVLGASLEKPFDETVLLWHLATDFCFHHRGASSPGCARLSRHVSNYMMHLLFANSDMLMPGSRVNLFTTACGELEDILHGEDLRLLDEEKLVQKIAEKVGESQGFVPDAWVLAQELMGLEDMWEVIRGVWVEILCFSAGRCRGFLHAKSLGYGGEYLSFVWLLMAHAGLETFPERQQRVQLRRPKQERVSIARQRIEEAVRNEAAGAPPAEIEVVVS